MDTTIMGNFGLHQVCQAYIRRLSASGGEVVAEAEHVKGLLDGYPEEELGWLARQVEVQLVYHNLAFEFATSTCRNCCRSAGCDKGRETLVSHGRTGQPELWRALFCSGYAPDFNGLKAEMRRLQEIVAMLRGYGLPVRQETVEQCLDLALRHWLDELALTGHAVPAELAYGFHQINCRL